MTDGNTYAINKHLEREDYDELQEVTAELQQAESAIISLIDRIEELEAKLAKAIEDLKSIERMGDGPFNIAAYLIARRCIAELKGQDDE